MHFFIDLKKIGRDGIIASLIPGKTKPCECRVMGLSRAFDVSWVEVYLVTSERMLPLSLSCQRFFSSFLIFPVRNCNAS